MARRDWWIGLALLALLLLVNVLVPRYTFEFRQGVAGGAIVYRIDRWSGSVELWATGGEAPAWLRLATSGSPR